MATVIGIFEDYYKKKTINSCKPGTQTRRFTHIKDTVNVCFEAWKKNQSVSHYSIISQEI